MGEMIDFPSNGNMCSGYLATPKSGHGPGVVVIQEWWGLVPHIKDICDRLAREGFVAVAPDLFHGKQTFEPDEAGKLVMAMRLDEAARDMLGAVSWLSNSDRTAGDRVGIVGYCVGGSLSLYAATLSPHIGCAVLFYPGLAFPAVQQADLSKISGAVLGQFAENDHSYTREQVADLERRLREAGIDVEFFWYAGADHGFFNDDRPAVYNPDAAQLAWDRTLAFFRRHLAVTATPV